LNLTTYSNLNFKISCIGFNNNEIFIFDPFETYSYLFSFITEQLSFAKKSFLDLKNLFSSNLQV
jgi:hypothetical protein